MATTDYAADIATYVSKVNAPAVATIVKYCGIALTRTDSSIVSCADVKELERVRDGFAKKKLGLSAESAERGMARVCATMKAKRNKSRVTFYYLLASTTRTMSKLG